MQGSDQVFLLSLPIAFLTVALEPQRLFVQAGFLNSITVFPLALPQQKPW